MKKRILCLLVCAVMLMSVAALAAFAEEPAALGAVCSADKTVFGYQNAEATAVSVKVYATLNDTDEGAAELGTYPMTAGENGIWSVTVDGDLNGRYYTYVYTAGADPVEIPDPQNTVEGAVRSQIKAAVQYDLWVAGIQVTSGNAQDVLGAADEGATVLFNGETNTLTLAAGANITGEGAGAFYIELKDGVLHVEPYEYYDHHVKLIASGENFLKIASGEMNAVMAYTAGKLHVEGDLGKALELQNIIEELRKADKKKKKK